MTELRSVPLDKPANGPAERGVFLGLPTGDGRLDVGTMLAIASARATGIVTTFSHVSRSLLTYNFNQLWVQALCARNRGECRYFAMIHSDVSPQDCELEDENGKRHMASWLTAMILELKSAGVTALSAAIAIKDDSGHTSTALDGNDKHGNADVSRRLTVAELAGKTVTTRECPNLLINTGCMVIDMADRRVDHLVFRFRDAIQPTSEGLKVYAHSEDWEMSRDFARWQVPFGVTGKVLVKHRGYRSWPNWMETP